MPIWVYTLIILAIAFGTWAIVWLFRAAPKQRNFADTAALEFAIHDAYMERKYPGATARRAAFNAAIDRKFKAELRLFLCIFIGSAVVLGILFWIAVSHGQ